MKKSMVWVWMLSILLSSCSVFGPVNPPDDKRYTISAMPVGFKPMRHTGAILLVTQPETSGIYNTTNMAYTVKPYQVSYYSQNQWAETPSQMVLPILAQSLEKTGAFKAVVVAPYLGKYDYVLNTQIIKIQQNYLNNSQGYFELVIQAQLVRVSNGATIATKQFSVNTLIGAPSPYNGVLAANEAMARALIQICQFAAYRVN